MAKNPLRNTPIGPLDRVHMNGRVYRATVSDSTGWHLQTVNGDDEEGGYLYRAQLADGIATGRIVVVKPPQLASSPEHSNFETVADYPLSVRKQMMQDTLWVQALQYALNDGQVTGRSQNAVAAFIEARKDDIAAQLKELFPTLILLPAEVRYGQNIPDGMEFPRAPKARTLLRKLQKFEAGSDLKSTDNSRILALRYRHDRCVKGGRRLKEQVRKIIDELAEKYAGEPNSTFAGLYKLVRTAILDYNKALPADLHLHDPDIKSLIRRVRNLPVGQVIGGRRTKSLARVFGSGRKGPKYTRVGERVESDCWNIPLHIRIPEEAFAELPEELRSEITQSRIYIAVTIDCASGYILGLGFGLTEDAALTTSAFRMCFEDRSAIAEAVGCTDKWDMRCGFENSVSDGGPAYRAEAFRSAAVSLALSHTHAASGIPKLRARIERIFSTIHKQFITLFSARAFENPTKMGDYEGSERANLNMEDFFGLMIKYIVDVYHHLPRDGGLRFSPRREFEELAREFEAEEVPTPEKLLRAFGVEITRKLDRHGVRFMNIEYNNDSLVRSLIHLGKRDVSVKIDPKNIGIIGVRVENDWLIVEGPSEYQGVTLKDWIDFNHDLRRRVGEQASIDFERYVAPALGELWAAARKSEAKLGLRDTFWTEKTLQREEDRLKLFITYNRNPALYQAMPSVEGRTLGYRRDTMSPPEAGKPAAVRGRHEAEDI